VSTRLPLEQITLHLSAHRGGRGDSEKNFPTKSRPLFIPVPKVHIYFHSDGSNNDWGYKLYAVADEDPYQKRKNSDGALVIESPHNYLDNSDEYRKISIPGGMQ
jgi:hypothetical protein